eukprot:scaffold5522_cov334-Pinguiococcus_pyrenoidosus.AAC.1
MSKSKCASECKTLVKPWWSRRLRPGSSDGKLLKRARTPSRQIAARITQLFMPATFPSTATARVNQSESTTIRSGSQPSRAAILAQP